MKELKIRIPLRGEMTIEASGYSDDSCLEATRPFEEAAGKVTSRKRKREASVPAKVEEKARVQGT